MGGWRIKANIFDQGRRHRRYLFAVRFPSHIQRRVVENSVGAAGALPASGGKRSRHEGARGKSAVLGSYSCRAGAADLSTLPSPAWGPPHQEHEWFLGPNGAAARIPHRPRFVTGDMATLRLAALRGVGVVQPPTVVVRKDVAEGKLVDVLPQWATRTAIIHPVFPSRRGLPPALRAFLDFLRSNALSRAETQEGTPIPGRSTRFKGRCMMRQASTGYCIFGP
jgi:DNA-binding transcriptional LysR family regulator